MSTDEVKLTEAIFFKTQFLKKMYFSFFERKCFPSFTTTPSVKPLDEAQRCDGQKQMHAPARRSLSSHTIRARIPVFRGWVQEQRVHPNLALSTQTDLVSCQRCVWGAGGGGVDLDPRPRGVR